MRRLVLLLAISIVLVPVSRALGQSEACCLSNGSCADMPVNSGLCEALLGVPQGEGTSCAGGDCATSACCLPLECVQVEAAEDCDALAGTWQGFGSDCPDAGGLDSAPSPGNQADV